MDLPGRSSSIKRRLARQRFLLKSLRTFKLFIDVWPQSTCCRWRSGGGVGGGGGPQCLEIAPSHLPIFCNGTQQGGRRGRRMNRPWSGSSGEKASMKKNGGIFFLSSWWIHTKTFQKSFVKQLIFNCALFFVIIYDENLKLYGSIMWIIAFWIVCVKFCHFARQSEPTLLLSVVKHHIDKYGCICQSQHFIFKIKWLLFWIFFFSKFFLFWVTFCPAYSRYLEAAAGK